MVLFTKSVFSDLDAQLQQLRQKRYRRHKIQSSLRQLEDELEDLKTERNSLKIAMDEEKKDVERLKGMSAGRLMNTVMMKQKKKLKKEEEEYIVATAQFEEAEHSLQDIRNERRNLRRAFDKLEGIDSDYNKTYAQWKKAAKNPSLVKADEDVARLEAEMQELEEGMEAGVLLYEKLEAVGEAMDLAVEHIASGKKGGIGKDVAGVGVNAAGGTVGVAARAFMWFTVFDFLM